MGFRAQVTSPDGIQLTRMPNGDLVADRGGPMPEEPAGYEPDPDDPYRFHPVGETPQECRRCRGL